MIREEKLRQAIEAIKNLVIIARTMAYEREDHKRMAEFLDDVEYLPCLILAKEDETECFNNYLKGISEKFPCVYIFERFDEDSRL